LIGTLLLAAGLWGAMDRSMDGGGSGLMLTLGVALIATCAFWFFRERRYFDPRNAYWIEIGIDEFALVTPDVTDRSSWERLSPFDVRVTRTRYKTKFGDRESVTYDAAASYGNLGVTIPLGDFASMLANDRLQQARAICAILNELRQSALNRRSGEPSQPFQVPSGLVVAPMPRPKRRPLATPNSVVQRQ
jgi:hypothetical protein